MQVFCDLLRDFNDTYLAFTQHSSTMARARTRARTHTLVPTSLDFFPPVDDFTRSLLTLSFGHAHARTHVLVTQTEPFRLAGVREACPQVF